MLLSTSTKIDKSNKLSNKYLAVIQYLSPYKISGKNLCPHASKACIQNCLHYAGMGRFNSVQTARLKRTQFFLNDFNSYKKQLYKEIESHRKKCKKLNLIPAVRLNGTSDINWKKWCPDIFQEFQDVMFWDYTKDYKRCLDLIKDPIKNYHLTFSRTENNEQKCFELLKLGINSAFVFEKIPKKYKGFKVINGDENDFRWIDKKGIIVGLTPKGRMKKEMTGFVIRGDF